MGDISVRRSSSSRRTALVIQALLLVVASAFMATRQFCFATSHSVGPELHAEESRRVNVYIYDDPVFDETAVIRCFRDHLRTAPWQAEAHVVQDTGEIWLHQSLLSHPWRVLDPKDADVFFIPMYPVLNAKLQLRLERCDGLTSQERATKSIMHLVKKSPYFNRYGGADHVVVCSWWNCGRGALGPQHRMLLRRTVVGINEQIDLWSNWGCRERMVTVPYTPSSTMTTPTAIGGRSAKARTIPFFFVGTSRGVPERDNLQVVTQISPESMIFLGESEHHPTQSKNAYAHHMSRSRFCFCPRGDTISSRRIYDAISAGCIPIITTEEATALAFIRTGLNYSEFAVVAENGTLSTVEGITAIVQDLSSRSDEQLASLREGLARGKFSTLYGLTTGGTLADMIPFHDTASRFLQDVKITLDNGGLWNCPSSNMGEDMLSPRTLTVFPPTAKERSQWLHESETIVNVGHSLLFCAPPNAGSLQFRMLSRRMQGVHDWSVSTDHSLLFDSVDSKLHLLDVTDKRLMEAIYRDNGSGWIKVGVVRDPVTRLLSAYFDLVRTWPSPSKGPSSGEHGSQHPHRGLWTDDGWAWLDAIARHRGLSEGDVGQQQPKAGEHQNQPTTWNRYRGGGAGREGGGGSRRPQYEDIPIVPTFDELLDILGRGVFTAPSAFRPAASLCGMELSPFDTIIPFETLQETSTAVVQSLPGDIWRDFGESGWGPHGKHAFMEFDYGTVATTYRQDDQDTAGDPHVGQERYEEANGQTTSPPTIPPRARDLFSDGSCAWTEYYTDQAVLGKVGHLYRQDFRLFQWYDLDAWQTKLEACLKQR